MGLVSSVIHLRSIEPSNALEALDRCLRGFGFTRSEHLPVAQSGPGSLAGHDQWRGPYYLVSQRRGQWLTIIEVQPDPEGVPYIYDLSNKLSAKLSTYALLFAVHDSDLFTYNFDYRGIALDGYNSCPQYFAREPLSEPEIEEQRHTPHQLNPICPDGLTMAQLEQILNDGFWSAFDAGKRGDELVTASAERRYIEEGDRMRDFGQLLQLNGEGGGYPYAAWAESSDIQWKEFQAVRYVRSTGLSRLFGKLTG